MVARSININIDSYRGGGAQDKADLVPKVVNSGLNQQTPSTHIKTERAPLQGAMSNSLHGQDFFAWANEQARLLRTGKLDEADIDHIAEEIETLARAEKRELVNHLSVLLLHLLKWQYQPVRRGASREVTIRNQRRALADHLMDNPSLKARFAESTARAYEDARGEAYAETGIPEAMFLATCVWSMEQIMASDFWPEQGA